MSDVQTMVRTEIIVNGHSFLLAQNQDLGDIQRRIETAARESGVFVEFTVVGNRSVSVLITAGTTVVFTVETVEFDPRDTGDRAEPFGGEFDF